jgi:two-component system chemotaxis sensor kinase CheA
MNDAHRQTFVSEARESITELNNALLALEEDPTDESAIESVFRTAHTLKGNFAAMGFGEASDLAHALEDLLDEIRQGRIEVTPDVMDTTFEGVDHIEAIVDDIEAGGEVSVDPSSTVERIRATMDAHAGAGESTADDGAASDDDPADAGTSATDEDDGFAHATESPTFDDTDQVLHARVVIGTGEMAGVDAMFVLETVEEAFDRVEFAPPRGDIETGEYDGAFDVFVPGSDEAVLSGQLDSVGNVESFTVRTLGAAAGGTPADVAGASERQVTSSGSGSDEISSVRVDVDRLDELHGLVEQLVTNRINIRRSIENEAFDPAENYLGDLDKVTSRLQNTVMDMRLIPLRRVVSRLPRVVRDVAREEDTEISFEMYGKDIELDRSILAEIDDPLIHVLRNAVDHGIEPPDERERKGKPREGCVELRAQRQRDHVTIEVEDDGRGLDADRLREKAVAEGVLTEAEAESMPDTETYDLVFHPGLSTSDEVTDVSGRGVGMDVVHRTVERLDGSVTVESEPDEGTTVRIRLPVSVAIVDVLFVEVDGLNYGIPIKNIDEITRDDGMESLNGDEVVRHDDEIFPVVRLSEALDVDTGSLDGTGIAADGGRATARDDGMLVRIRPSERAVAIRCDRVHDQEEVVVKPLDGALSGISTLSGTAILGDGNIIPILDVTGL